MALEAGFCMVNTIRDALVLLIPALAANPAPVLARGKRPIDGGRKWIDGKRVLGDGKTWEGLIAGLAAGTIAGITAWRMLGEPLGLLHAFTLSLGALLGDIAGSFIKRRLSLPRGAPAPVLDQLDFYAGAVAASYLLGCMWSPETLALTAVIVAVLHVTSNFVAYLAGLKREPW